VVVLLSGAVQNPSHVCPPTAVAWCVRIAGRICVRMMNSVRDYPIDRTAFECERATDRHKIFDQLGRLITAMCKESVKAHSHSQTPHDPPEHKGGHQGLPTKYKERGQRAHVKECH